MIIEDPKDRERSLMFKKPTVCDGQRDGFQCKHYWFFISRVDVANPDALRTGRKDRFCVFNGGTFPMGDGGSELAVECNKYERSETPYTDTYKTNNPMTEDEILALRSADPTDTDDEDDTNA